MSKLPVFGAERWRNFWIPCRSPYWSCWLTAVVVWTVVASCDQLDGLATCSSAIAGRALTASDPNARAMTSRKLFMPYTPSEADGAPGPPEVSWFTPVRPPQQDALAAQPCY